MQNLMENQWNKNTPFKTEDIHEYLTRCDDYRRLDHMMYMNVTQSVNMETHLYVM